MSADPRRRLLCKESRRHAADVARPTSPTFGRQCTATCNGHMSSFSALPSRRSSPLPKVSSHTDPCCTADIAAIIPALPLASTSATTDEEGESISWFRDLADRSDDRLVRIALQRWLGRVCEDPVLLKDDELRSFIESDFGVSRRCHICAISCTRSFRSTNPSPRPLPDVLRPQPRLFPRSSPPRCPRSSAAALSTRTTSSLRPKALWSGWRRDGEEPPPRSGNLARREEVGERCWISLTPAHAVASQDVGAKLVSLSTVESDLSLANAERKFGRSLEQLAGMAGAQVCPARARARRFFAHLPGCE